MDNTLCSEKFHIDKNSGMLLSSSFSDLTIMINIIIGSNYSIVINVVILDLSHQGPASFTLIFIL